MLSYLFTALLAGHLVRGQGVGTYQTETHPSMSWSKCSGSGGSSCSSQSGKVVIDANWRWLHAKGDYTNCYTGNTWNATLCPNNSQCSSNCVVDGADYSGTYGVTTSGNALTIKFVTKGQYSTNIGSRLYLMADDSSYQMFSLIGNEFTFDVDVSKLGCGLNGALYFVTMDSKGQGTAGAKYGTGYCDGQCPRDLKFINGQVCLWLRNHARMLTVTRPTLRAGRHLPTIRTPEWADTALAAPRWMSGRPTPSRLL
jgi:cellulose 1,4-beta-cellobiosidase